MLRRPIDADIRLRPSFTADDMITWTLGADRGTTTIAMLRTLLQAEHADWAPHQLDREILRQLETGSWSLRPESS